jgi:hypothetical protein
MFRKRMVRKLSKKNSRLAVLRFLLHSLHFIHRDSHQAVGNSRHLGGKSGVVDFVCGILCAGDVLSLLDKKHTAC